MNIHSIYFDGNKFKPRCKNKFEKNDKHTNYDNKVTCIECIKILKKFGRLK